MGYHPEAVRKAYDEIAEKEDQFEKSFSLRNAIPREFIKRYLRASDIVLDAGGGSGINAVMMAQICQRVTLVDISPRLLDLAAANIRDAGLTTKIDLMEGDVTHLEHRGDAAFSFVTCLGGTLSYVRDQGQQALQELVRVARPGAVLIIGCDSRYGFVRWLLNAADSDSQLDSAVEVYEAGEYEAGEGAFVHLYTVAELTALIESAGCEIVEIASTPTLLDAWEQSTYPEDQQEKLKALELRVCTVPELLGTGHHLLCVARKR
jgi:ubiquinone/menaquinone biosynthesis C-methylase UbiE